MKRLLILGVFALAACGGGGGGGNSLPSAPRTPPTANTALPYYLPLANGNTWTFASGGKMVDMGSTTLTCTCPDNGGAMERIALYAPSSSAIGGSIFVTKNTPQGGTQLTNMVAVENDGNTNNLTIASTAAFTYGIPFMDDSPKQNESWTDGLGTTSTITSTGGTLTMGTSQIIDVATNQIASAGISWSFAKGVGFAMISSGGQSTGLASFAVNGATSMTSHRSVAFGHVGTPDFSIVKLLLR